MPFQLDQYDIYLVGMPGAGKSTVGRALAGILNRDFIDLDDYIERKEGRTVREIFTSEGESRFREIEAIYLRGISDAQGGQVIATGGGTPCFAGNMDLINSRGVSVYLKVPSEILAERIWDNRQQRPLITSTSRQQLITHLQQTLAWREPYYLRANLTISEGDPDPGNIIRELEAII